MISRFGIVQFRFTKRHPANIGVCPETPPRFGCPGFDRDFEIADAYLRKCLYGQSPAPSTMAPSTKTAWTIAASKIALWALRRNSRGIEPNVRRRAILDLVDYLAFTGAVSIREAEALTAFASSEASG